MIDVRYFRPENKHGEADALRKSEQGMENNQFFSLVLSEINSCHGRQDTVPVTLYKTNTREYCIIPISNNPTDSAVVSTIEYLRGQGWYVEIFRVSESMDNPEKYRHALLVCWDPRIRQQSMSPRYYNQREGIRVPCGVCRKHQRGEVAHCEGCLTLRMWLAGAGSLKNFGDPCYRCVQNRDHLKPGDGVVDCDGCPTKDLWMHMYSPSVTEEADTYSGDQADDASETTANAEEETAEVPVGTSEE